MKENENHQEAPGAGQRLTDSLLKTYAANLDGSEDVAFLEQVEASIDADGVEPFTTPPRKTRPGLLWAGGIAALLMVGIGIGFHKAREARNDRLYAHTGEGSASAPWNQQAKVPAEAPPLLNDGAMEKRTVQKSIVRAQQRPTSTATASAPVPADASTFVFAGTGRDPRLSITEDFDDSLNVSETTLTQTEYREMPGKIVEVNGTPKMRIDPVEATLTSGMKLSKNVDVYTTVAPTSEPHYVDAERMKISPNVEISVPPSSGFGSGGSAPSHHSGPRYGELVDNRWKTPFREPLSTFSIDVDTASWTNIRGMLDRGVPLSNIPKDAVRIEEMVNYFDWKYPQPNADHPFGFAIESASCPWNEDNRLLRVAIQGKDLKPAKRPPANLVFLIDVSGSMRHQDKLPLVQRAISVLIEELDEDDTVSMVVYAGSEGVALHPTRGNEQAEILDALERLRAGGSTNGGAGIGLAYKLAAKHFDPEGINRVILCTDGDFNVGMTGTETLVDLVERKAKRDQVFLSVCGFGDDNLNDAMLEAITNKGNGTYYYIDTFAEARKVFLKDLMGTLVTIAKDVKIQIEFNPGEVKAYRLIGYANRQLKAKDFEDDRVDAGEIGAGHSVTAFYEIVPAGSENDPTEMTSNLRYQQDVAPEPPPQPKREVVPNPELALVKLRYKKPDEDTSNYVQQPVMPNDRSWRKASADFRFAAAVALFGLKLRDHESVRSAEIADVAAMARKATGNDPHGYRAEFVKLVEQAKE